MKIIKILSFHFQQLTDQWQESEIRENLSRMSILTDGLKMKIGMLSQNASNSFFIFEIGNK